MFPSASVSFTCFYYIILCATFFSSLESATSIDNCSSVLTIHNRYRRQTNCPGNETTFQCNSGQCISENNLCDGKEDCQDGTDENDCLNTPCNQYLFRCNYGACINKQLECNGNKDCKDNSDESHCKKPTAVTEAPINNCGDFKFDCDSGQCIKDTDLCDGKLDCEDGSDETQKICSTFQCPKSTFRCKYGACVGKGKRCNGERDCADGSDEVGCVTIKPPPGPTTVSTPITKPTPSTGPPPAGSCVMPNNPPNGLYTVGETPPGTYKPGVHIPQFNVLVTQCNRMYKPNPPDSVASFCSQGFWLPPPPTCSQSCRSVNSTKTTNITCTFKGRPLESCNNPIEDTFAAIACEPLHEEPSLLQKPFRVCRDGSWDHPFTQCYPVCGQKRPEGNTNILGGKNAKQGDYPWHIGIYRSSSQEHICGGSILNERVILSAAHCFTNPDNGIKYPKEDYLIAAGKYYREYADPRDKFPQYSAVENIHIPTRYKGNVNQYEGDIAVVILTSKLTLSVTVQPVCIDWSTSFEYQQISGYNKGVVVGWGQTVEGNMPSQELKELSVPVIPYEDCYEQVPRAFRRFLTYDKVCAGFLGNATAVCQGDSGGGLAFATLNDRYYIRGVVSTSPATIDGNCDSNQYGTYTLVSKHIEFVKQYGV